jgi:hypothetical protein
MAQTFSYALLVSKVTLKGSYHCNRYYPRLVYSHIYMQALSYSQSKQRMFCLLGYLSVCRPCPRKPDENLGYLIWGHQMAAINGSEMHTSGCSVL